jgi:ATP-dependent DNA helicase RecG
MTADDIKHILSRGEGMEVEFKKALFDLPKSTFETICAFLNRKGGHLLLGVANDGTVEGVLEESAAKMINELVTAANNPQKLSPPVYLAPEVILYEGKSILYCFVPESSQVHRTAGRIFDRNATDGDIDVTDSTHQVTQLYLRKQQTYTENRIYPYAALSDFRPDLIQRVRIMAGNQRTGHPWTTLSDEELLLSAGLRLKDPITGQEGYTLAGLLLLGRDNIILSALPHHKTDALLRVRDTDRYDDRDDIRTNLIESYDRLMAFVGKHLPDPFYLLGTQRVSLRDKIFREVVANLLVHREFANAFPAKFIIEREGVHTENWNRPHHHGLLLPGKALPYPKNPVIARFFREIGLVEELGSGLRNAFQFVPAYSGGKVPLFEEEDVFRCFIPVEAAFFNQQDGGKKKEDTVNDTVNRIHDTVNDTVNLLFGTETAAVRQRLKSILQLIYQEPGIRKQALIAATGVSDVTLKRDMQKLKELAVFKGPQKTGGYYLTDIFAKELAE